MELKKKRRYWLFMILLSYLIIIYGLPADVLNYIDLLGLYYVFVCMNVALAEILVQVMLIVYRTLLALFLAVCFQLACVRLEENTVLSAV